MPGHSALENQIIRGKNMKKILIALVLLIAGFGLVACDGDMYPQIGEDVYSSLVKLYQDVSSEYKKHIEGEEELKIDFTVIAEKDEYFFTLEADTLLILIEYDESGDEEYSFYINVEQKDQDSVVSYINEKLSAEVEDDDIEGLFESLSESALFRSGEITLTFNKADDFSGIVKQLLYVDYSAGSAVELTYFSYTSSSVSFEVKLTLTGDLESDTYVIDECLITYNGVIYDASAISNPEDWD